MGVVELSIKAVRRCIAFLECRAFSDVCRCMKARKEKIAIWRLDEKRYAISVDQVIRYVGSQEECQRRAEILLPKDSRKEQDNALMRACQLC